MISKARPKIADYPFTTKIPVLGVVQVHETSFTVADLPGLIEGASQGAGLGIQFLKHVERTKILVHLIDLSDPARTDPLVAYRAIRSELKSYNPDLLKRPEIVVLTKADLPEVQEEMATAKRKLGRVGPNRAGPNRASQKILTISAATHEGIDKLLVALEQLMKKKKK